MDCPALLCSEDFLIDGRKHRFIWNRSSPCNYYVVIFGSLLDLVFPRERLTFQRECLFAGRSCPGIFQEITADLYSRPSQIASSLTRNFAFYARICFYVSSVAASYSVSKLGCTRWMPTVPSSHTGDAL